MKLKNYLLILLLAGTGSAASGQITVSKSNAFFAPFFKMISTSQEAKIAPRLTVQTTVRTRPASQFGLFGLGKVHIEGQDYEPFGKTTLSSVGNISEFRVYSKSKGAFHGFYYGPYFSYTHYKLKSASVRGEFHDKDGVAYYGDISQVIKLNVTGGGFEFGTQGMFIKNRLAIDWTILGVGFGWLGFEGGIEADNTSENFDFRNYTDADNVKLGIEKIFHFNRTIEPTSMTIGAGIPWIMMRTGVSIGFGYGSSWHFGKKKKSSDSDNNNNNGGGSSTGGMNIQH